ncbi:hypothetical protein MUK42_29111 [Musa troglodytarum]|uniref:Uncharacterized protein n=1 Tax=Musa troglodytarum TaxID=320322 RepID=A0A9E7GD81_9LILI|nr:hypothetical protein MUK42_29111 [Musa troglodytarum]
MIMAVEDFYKANPDFTTRLFHWRDADNSSISAASAGAHHLLLCNESNHVLLSEPILHPHRVGIPLKPKPSRPRRSLRLAGSRSRVRRLDYGASIVPHLIDALQEVGVDVPNRSMIPLSATADRRLVLGELELSRSRTRVFVVTCRTLWPSGSSPPHRKKE